MLVRFMKSKWWHLFGAFYMLATIAYILMAGFMISTLFMLGIEVWNFASDRCIK